MHTSDIMYNINIQSKRYLPHQTTVQGKHVCDNGLALLLKTTVKRINRIRDIYRSGITTIIKVKPTGRKVSDRYACIHANGFHSLYNTCSLYTYVQYNHLEPNKP